MLKIFLQNTLYLLTLQKLNVDLNLFPELQHKHSFTEPLFEENNIQPTDIANEQGVPDLAADSKSLGDGSLESSPGSSLAHSWESTGSETFAGQRKKSLTSKIDRYVMPTSFFKLFDSSL